MSVGRVAHQTAVSYIQSVMVHGWYLLACRQLHYIVAISQKGAEVTDQESTGPLIHKGLEGSLEITTVRGTGKLQWNNISSQRARGRECFILQVLGNRRDRKRKIGNPGCRGD